MNTVQLKKFASEARTILKEGVILRLNAMGFKSDGSVAEEDRPHKGQGFVLFRGEALPDDGFYERWQSLYDRVQKKGLQEVYEEAAYTWFNRLTAIRIMARNGFIPPVLEYVSSTTRIPVILSQAREGIFPEMSAIEHEQLISIIDDGRKSQEQFAILITAYCHANPVINKCFGGVTDYTTLLLPQNIISEGGFIDLLNNTPFISEDDYKSAELIGWLYQYYVSERHDEVYAKFDKGGKADSSDIPPATQIFTPNWIVKYMVQNTLGRIYIDNNPYDTEIKEKMKYLVEPSEQTPEDSICRYEKLEDLRLGDLACGSGHILNEFFDLLYLLYIEEGYSRRAAIENIFLRNLTGIDLDTRAKQLSQFALLVKACQKDPSFLDAAVMPNVLDMPAPLEMSMVKQTLPEFFLGENTQMQQEMEEAFTVLQQAENLGSIMRFNLSNKTQESIKIRLKEWESQPLDSINRRILELLQPIKLIIALTSKYTCLVANPPYMGRGNMNKSLLSYIDENYNISKQDLFSVFMDMMLERTSEKGYTAFITMESWMFLSTFEKFRKEILDNYYIASCSHFGWHIIGIAFGTAMTVLQKEKSLLRKGEYSYLTMDGIDKSRNIPYVFPIKDNHKYSIKNQSVFSKILGSPIAYDLSPKMIEHFENDDSLTDLADLRSGISTGDNDLFYRLWYEINKYKMAPSHNSTPFNSQYKWFKIIRGGNFRKWYGNCDNLINLENSCFDIKNSGLNHRLRTPSYYTKYGITWNRIANKNLGFRIKESDFNFGENSPCMFVEHFDKRNTLALLALLNTKCIKKIIRSLNPTLSNQLADILKIPVCLSSFCDNFYQLIEENIEKSKLDWDAHETSWDFKENELLSINAENFIDIINDYANFHKICIDPAAPEPMKLEWRYEMYKKKWETFFYRLKQNEEELNRQFIKIYGLQDELEANVRTDEITILQQGEIQVIKDSGDDSGCRDYIEFNKDVIISQLISYAIGCWMGRFRLDKPGLHIANPDAKPEEIDSYEYNGQKFEIDDDGIIPLLPAYASFADNGINRIVDFLRIAFGPENLTENINFVEEALGMTIEKYMVKEFWKFHKKMYQNHPIYWLFSSKKGAFQCITYMHRMNAYTAEQIRSKYLLPHIDWLKNHIAEMESRASQLTTQERRLKDQMQKDLVECLEYHDELHVVADHNITFELDNGVLKNYALFGNVLAKLK